MIYFWDLCNQNNRGIRYNQSKIIYHVSHDNRYIPALQNSLYSQYTHSSIRTLLYWVSQNNFSIQKIHRDAHSLRKNPYRNINNNSWDNMTGYSSQNFLRNHWRVLAWEFFSWVYQTAGKMGEKNQNLYHIQLHPNHPSTILLYSILEMAVYHDTLR